MVIAKLNFIGNWKRSNSNGSSYEIHGSVKGRHIRAYSSLEHPFLTSRTYDRIASNTNLVPLHTCSGSKFMSNIIGTSVLSVKLWGNIPDGCREIRNSVWKTTARSWSMIMSRDLKVCSFPGNSCNRYQLTLSTAPIFRAMMACSQNQWVLIKFCAKFWQTCIMRYMRVCTISPHDSCSYRIWWT